MVSPLEGPLRRTIGKAFNSVFYAATLVKSTPGSGPAYDPGPPTLTNYPCRGMVDTYSAYFLANSLISAGDVKIIILATSLKVTPAVSDKVKIRGKQYSVIKVEPDPANATWTIQGRN